MRRTFEELKRQGDDAPKIGLMKLRPSPGEYRYAVAVSEAGKLWLTLWVRRSKKGEFFVLIPRKEKNWDVHTSYHVDGKMHIKSYGETVFTPKQRQPLTANFRGSEHLGSYYGFAPKGIGAICDPACFSGVLELPTGVLGPRDGGITVDLVDPGAQPGEFPWARIVTRQVFREVSPWVVITVGYS